MDRFFVRPVLDPNAAQEAGQAAARLKVRKPIGGHLAAEGEMVDRDSYWLRRLADSDVEEATPPADSEPAATRAKRT